MKLKILPFENEIVFSDKYVSVLEINNNTFFAKIITSINNLINDQDSCENIILIENDKVIDIAKNAIMLIDILNIEYNNKKIICKLYQKLSNIFNMEEELRQKFEERKIEMLRSVTGILEESFINLSFRADIVFEEVLKLLNVKINTYEFENLIDRMLVFFDIVSYFELCKVLILCNVKCYFSNDEINELYKYSKHKKINLLLIESHCSDIILANEKKLIIDENFDDFLT